MPSNNDNVHITKKNAPGPGHELLFGRRVNQTNEKSIPCHYLFNGRRLTHTITKSLPSAN